MKYKNGKNCCYKIRVNKYIIIIIILITILINRSNNSPAFTILLDAVIDTGTTKIIFPE